MWEKRLTKQETQIEKKMNRRKREYTYEEKKAIRARLLAGLENSKKKRESEAKTNMKVKSSNIEKAKSAEAQI